MRFILMKLTRLSRIQVFETLRRENVDVLKKLVPIPGDITSPNLGISKESEQILHENVSVVIHSAATVKFDEVMSLSADINVGGVQRVLELAKNMKNIRVSFCKLLNMISLSVCKLLRFIPIRFCIPNERLVDNVGNCPHFYGIFQL